MKFKAVIFDLDGVICHTDHYHYQAWKTIADKQNIYFDEIINNRLRGVSRMESLEIILERSEKIYTTAEKLILAEQKNEIYKQLLKQMKPEELTKDVRDTLIKLKKMGIRIAIGSSSKNAKMILAQLGIINEFDAISDGNNIVHSKPDPEVFLKAAEMLKLDSKECLVVEDAVAGINAALAGGFVSAGIGEAAEYQNTDYALRKISELLMIM